MMKSRCILAVSLGRFLKRTAHSAPVEKLTDSVQKKNLPSGFPSISNLFQPVSVIPKDIKKVHEDKISKSHRLMNQYGLIRHSNLGNYHLLPLAVKSLEKLTKLIDDLMLSVGGQKISMPCLISGDLWKITGRWDEMDTELFKLKDRHNKDFCLGPTHEEAITQLVASTAPISYKQLPLKLYQITKKFRDEKRPKFGLLRGKEFIMKDLYSFDCTEEAARDSYEKMCEAYSKLFDCLGLNYKKVLGSTGTIGGSMSHEFHVISDIGEDKLLLCSSCDYGANTDFIDIQTSMEKCPSCSSTLYSESGIEVGHAFLLGTKYSQKFKATFQSDQGKSNIIQMGCYGLGVTRIVAAAIEQLSLAEEIRWPENIAPYKICIISPKAGSKESSAITVVSEIASHLSEIPNYTNDVILDDRDQFTIGKRLLEARKVGYPVILIVGKEALQDTPYIEVHHLKSNTVNKMTLPELYKQLDCWFSNIQNR